MGSRYDAFKLTARLIGELGADTALDLTIDEMAEAISFAIDNQSNDEAIYWIASQIRQRLLLASDVKALKTGRHDGRNVDLRQIDEMSAQFLQDASKNNQQ